MRHVPRLAHVLIILGCIGVAAAQNVNVNPQALLFSYQIGGSNPPSQVLNVFNDVPTQFTVTISGAPWLSISPTSGITPNALVATVTPPSGAAPGTLNGSIIIGPPASTDAVKVVVPVSLQILPAQPGNLTVSPASITFDYQTGGPNPSPYNISVTSTGGAAAFTVGASTSSGGSWLSVSMTNGVTPATFSAYATPSATMAAGTYTGTISVIPSYAGATPQRVSVTLRVSSAGTLTASPVALSFNYQPGSPFPSPQTLYVTTSSGSPLSVNVSATTSSGGSPWLVVSPGIATTPFNVIVSVNPGALGPGVYYGNVSIAPAVGGAATLIPVSLSVYSYSQLVVNPTSLTFDYQSGGAAPPAQYVSVSSTGATVNFSAAVTGPPWVSLSTTRGTTPIALGVAVNPPATTAPGTYSASITLTPSTGAQVVIAVSVRVSGANYLTVGRNSISFVYAPGDVLPAPVIVPVSSSGGSIHYETFASTLGFSPWLNASQSSPYTPGHVYVSISPQGLAAGVYSGTVSVTSDAAGNSPQTINVTLTVSSQPNLTSSPFGMVFSYQMGGPAASMQMAVVSNEGTPMSFTLSAVPKTGGNWLIAAGGGTTPSTIAAAVDPSNLGPGTYNGSLVVTPTSGTGTPLEIPVILNVSPEPVFRPASNQVAFQYQRSGPTPQAQSVTIATTGSAPVAFYTGAESADGGKWLSVSPDAAASPSDVTISVNPQGLTPGMYYGVVVLNAASGGTSTSYIPVSLEVSDNEILTVPAQSLTFNGNAGGASTASKAITVKGTGRASSFQVRTYGGDWLQVSPLTGTADATLNAVATPGSLPAGYYFGVVSVEIPGVEGSQQYVPVAFVLSAP